MAVYYCMSPINFWDTTLNFPKNLLTPLSTNILMKNDEKYDMDEIFGESLPRRIKVDPFKFMVIIFALVITYIIFVSITKNMLFDRG